MGIITYLSEKFTWDKKPGNPRGSIYNFNLRGLDGQEVKFSHYKGKNLLIVNTASRCGYTPQYADLQKLHETYGDRVTVLGFPANNFLWQEPGTNSEIADFCHTNYGISFPMFEKISVKGKDQHPLYQWLSAKTGKIPSWNFCKYLVGKDGDAVTFYPAKINPLDQVITGKL